MVELSIGEMADLNGISRKTLRIYHDMGLLEPVRVDVETGYRYYAIGQSFTIERIQQLQEMGASLSDIEEALNSTDPQTLISLAQKLETELDAEIDRLRLAKYNASQIVKRNNRLSTLPVLDTPIFEHIPPRHALKIDFENEESVLRISGEDGPNLEAWEHALCQTKAKMRERNIPLELFQNIGMSMRQIDMENHVYQLNQVLLFVGSEGLARAYCADTIDEGDFLTIYKKGYLCDQGNSEYVGINQLQEAVEMHSFNIVGDWIEEILADIPATFAYGRDALFKLQVPVVPKQ